MGSRPFWSASTDARSTQTGTLAMKTFVTLGPQKFQPSTDNIVMWGCCLDGDTTGTEVVADLYDGTSTLDAALLRTVVTHTNGGRFHVFGFVRITESSTPVDRTFTLRFGLQSNTSLLAGCQDGFICAFPLVPNVDVFEEVDAESTISVNAWAAGTDKLTKTFTPATTGNYLVLAKCAVQPQTSGPDAEIRLYNSTSAAAYSTVDNFQQRAALVGYNNWLGGWHGSLTGSTSYTWKIQVGASTNTVKAKHARFLALRVDEMPQVEYAESRGTSTTTSTTLQSKVTKTYTAIARPYLEFASATVKHDNTTNWKAAMTIGGSAVDETELQTGSATATNYYSFKKVRFVTPTAGSRTLGLYYCSSTANTTTIEEAWVCAVRLNHPLPPTISTTAGW